MKRWSKQSRWFLVVLAMTASIGAGVTTVGSGTAGATAPTGGATATWGTPTEIGSQHGAGTFNSVSCTSATDCTAVGNDGLNAAYATETSAGWGPLTEITPPSGLGNLTGVSCTSATDCTAVGNDGNGWPFTVTETSAGWGTPIDVSPPGGSGTFAAVSCTSPTDCTAVGSGDGDRLPFAATETSAIWTFTNVTPPGSGPTSGSFTSVSCTAATVPGDPANCTAVGFDATDNQPIAVTGSAGTWGTPIEVSPTGGSGLFSAVSCTSATDCTAVGIDVGSNNPFIVTEALSGTWGTPADVTGAGPNDSLASITSVSCTSAIDCTGVGTVISGDFRAPSNNQVFTITESAGTWSAPADLVLAAEANQSALNGVSCTSATACTAVGINCSGLPFYVTSHSTPDLPTIDPLPATGVVGHSFVSAVVTNGDGARSITSADSSICSVIGTKVTFVATGTCALTAHVGLGVNYAAADGTEQDITVGVGSSASTVTTCADSGAGSLRDAVWGAASGATIHFAVTCTTITLTSGPIVLQADLTVTGPGAGSLAVSGAGSSQIFTLANGTNVSISGLTLRDGHAAIGGAIGDTATDNVTLTVTSCTLTGNTGAAFVLGGVPHGMGGAIGIYGTTTIVGSTLSGNMATFGGAILNQGPLSVIDSTVSGNSALGAAGPPFGGGGILADNFTGSGSILITGSTVSGNTAAIGGGMSILGDAAITDSTVVGNNVLPGGSSPFAVGGIESFNGTMTIGASIVADNTGATAASCLGIAGGSFTDAGYNVADDSSCGFTDPTSTNSSTTLDASLGSLTSNGGPTQTILPANSSPVVHLIPTGTTISGVQVCSRTDQRGVASIGTCTIGAVEVPGFVISSGTATAAKRGTAYSYQLQAAGIGSGAPGVLTTLKWAKGMVVAPAKALPKGLVLSSSGLLSGTPSMALYPGTFPIKVKVTETVTTLSGKKHIHTLTTVTGTVYLPIN